MSHADTIRTYIESWGYGHRQLEDGSRTAVQLPREPALSALDALLAENQQLRDALQRAHEACVKPEDDALARLKAANIIVCEALAGDAE